MNRFVRRAAMAALLAGTSSLLVLAPAPQVYAQYEGDTGQQMPALPPPIYSQDDDQVVSRRVGRPLVSGQEAFNDQNYTEALEYAQEVEAMEDKSSFEVYQVAKLIGLIAISTQDFPTAAAQFNRAIATGAMPMVEAEPTLRTAMLLNYNEKDYGQAIVMGNHLRAFASLDDQGTLVLTQSYYFNGDLAGAVQVGQQLIEELRTTGTSPSQGLLATIMNAQIELNDQEGARRTLEQLTLINPTPENWGRVVDGAFTQPNITDHQLLNLYRLRVATNATMIETDYLSLASLALMLGLPNEGKVMLEKGIDDGVLTPAAASEILEQANRMATADEASLIELEQLAQASGSGELDVKLGESYWTYGRDAEAEAAIRRGLEKGGVLDAADAYLTLGIILLDMGRIQEAIQAIEQSAQLPGGAQNAHVWNLYALSRG